MWAQMIKTRIKPGQEAELERIQEEMQERFGSQASSGGPSRVILLQDQKDPGAYISLLFFENEAEARKYEGSPQQQEIQKRMMQVWDGPLEFTDLNVTYEVNR